MTSPARKVAGGGTVGPGTLFVVATPIGNLEDLTIRALRILREVDLIAAEDTRHSRKLCRHYGITTPLTSYYMHNEDRKGGRIVDELARGKNVALISDAGTPGISDPGYLLVSRCRKEGIPIESVPGPSAVIAALSISGMPTEQFSFFGFLPTKQNARRTLVRDLQTSGRTAVFYESPRRLVRTLEIMLEELGPSRQVAVFRELTKVHEEMVAGDLVDVVGIFRDKGVRGEIVLLVAPTIENRQNETVREALIRVRSETGLPMRQVVKQVARQFGLPGSDVYKESLLIRNSEGR